MGPDLDKLIEIHCTNREINLFPYQMSTIRRGFEDSQLVANPELAIRLGVIPSPLQALFDETYPFRDAIAGIDQAILLSQELDPVVRAQLGVHVSEYADTHLHDVAEHTRSSLTHSKLSSNKVMAMKFRGLGASQSYFTRKKVYEHFVTQMHSPVIDLSSVSWASYTSYIGSLRYSQATLHNPNYTINDDASFLFDQLRDSNYFDNLSTALAVYAGTGSTEISWLAMLPQITKGTITDLSFSSLSVTNILLENFAPHISLQVEDASSLISSLPHDSLIIKHNGIPCQSPAQVQEEFNTLPIIPGLKLFYSVPTIYSATNANTYTDKKNNSFHRQFLSDWLLVSNKDLENCESFCEKIFWGNGSHYYSIGLMPTKDIVCHDQLGLTAHTITAGKKIILHNSYRYSPEDMRRCETDRVKAYGANSPMAAFITRE